MKVHLTWIGAAALVAAAFSVNQAGAQYAPYRPQQQAVPQATVLSDGLPVDRHGRRPRREPVSNTGRARRARCGVPAVSAVSASCRAAGDADSGVRLSANDLPANRAGCRAIRPAATRAIRRSRSSLCRQCRQRRRNGESLPAPDAHREEHDRAGWRTRQRRDARPGPGERGANGYSSTGYQTANGYSGYGQSSCGYTDYGINGCCEQECGSGNIWFGGLYWLFMERDNPNTAKADGSRRPQHGD